MAMQVKLNIRLKERPDEDLDVAAAFAENPCAVQDALCEAICMVNLPTHMFRLLRIVSTIQAALQEPWTAYKPLQPVLDACRQKKYGHRTERLFHENAGEEGVVVLALVSKHQRKLMDEIDVLPEEEFVKLAKLVKIIPKRAVIYEHIEGFAKSDCALVPEPPPIFSRPRVDRRVRGKSKRLSNGTPFLSPRPKLDTTDTVQHKRRRFSSTPEKQTHSAPPNSQTHTRLPDSDAHSSNASQHPTTEEHFTQPQIDEEWNFEQSFTMEGRPFAFPWEEQITGQEGHFMQTQMGEEWDLETSFTTEGRPLELFTHHPVLSQETSLNCQHHDDEQKDF